MNLCRLSQHLLTCHTVPPHFYDSLLSVPLPPSDLVYAPLATVKMLLDALEANRGLRSVDLTGNLMAIEMFSPHNAMRDPGKSIRVCLATLPI